MIAAHKLLLTNVTNAITIAWNCVRKFKANADRADTIIQTADATMIDRRKKCKVNNLIK